jgi:hypothetical protein
MARQHVMMNIGPGRVAISPALVGIAVLGFWSGLGEKAADTLCYLTCALSGMVLEALPRLMFVLGRGLESFALEHGWLLFGLRLLASAGLLLHWLAGAI